MEKSPLKTILIIEDEIGFRRIYRDIFRNRGHKVIEAEDGELGLMMAKAMRPDLILLDLVLPEVHGFEVLRNIRSDENIKDTPVIILSVLGEERDKQRGLELGADEYNVKGYNTPREITIKAEELLKK